MRDQPSAELLDLLDRLGLAAPEQVLAVRRRARRLARGLPLFDSVWVDALVGARLLTPFQAGEIHAGRGARLGAGPYAVLEPLADLGYARCYRAREIETQRMATLAIASRRDMRARSDVDQLLRQLRDVADRTSRVEATAVPPWEACGADQDRLWAAGPDVEGVTASEWMIRNGRVPPHAVLEIARQMACALAELERHELVHGDLSAVGLVLRGDGTLQLLAPCLRGALRPEEGYGLADLAPAAFDYLAPERIAEGTAPTARSDLYACGCLWWHLLTGRPPLAGGNSLAKLKAAQQARIGDVRLLAPDTPAPLAAAISQCTRPATAARPESFAALAASLGPSTREGRAAVADCLARQAPAATPVVAAAGSLRISRHAPVWLAAGAGCALMLAVATWPAWGTRVTDRLAQLLPAEEAPARVASGEWRVASESTVADPRQGAAPGTSSELPDPETLARSAARAKPRDAADFSDNRPVQQAAYHTAESPADELVLPPGATVEAASLRLKPGQRVRGHAGRRARVLVPPSGLRIPFDDLQFENLDFIAAAAPGEKVMIDLRAGRAAFRNCTFRPAPRHGLDCTAILWQAPPRTASARTGQPHQLLLENCVLSGVRLGVDCHAAGPLLIDMDNVLFVGSIAGAASAALSRLNRYPAVDRPVMIGLHRCTLRSAASLVDLAFRPGREAPGKISIEATACVFAPHSSGSLLRLFDGRQEERLAQMIDWAGQGSLLYEHIPFATRIEGENQVYEVDDSAVSVDGLVISRFDFVGEADDSVAASEIARWAAPLRNESPPGIRAGLLPR